MNLHRFLRPVFAFGIPALLLISGSMAKEPGGARAPSPPAHFLIGAQTHFAMRSRGYLLPETIRELSNLGLDSYRDDIGWSQTGQTGSFFYPPVEEMINASTGKFRPLLVIDNGDPSFDGGTQPLSENAQFRFAAFSGAVAQHFSGSEPLLEIWNEWNWATGTTGGIRAAPEDYVRLMSKVAPAVRAAKPNSVILGGGATNELGDWRWTARALQLGLAKYIDGLTIHPYSYCEKPLQRTAGFIVHRIDELHRITASLGAPDLPIYVSEIGWPSNDLKCFVNEKDAAGYSAQLILELAARPWIRGLWFYELVDAPENPIQRESNFGLLSSRHVPKIRARTIKDAVILVRSASLIGRSMPEPGITRADYRDSQGRWVSVLWAEQTNAHTRVRSDFPGGPMGDTITAKEILLSTIPTVIRSNSKVAPQLTFEPP